MLLLSEAFFLVVFEYLERYHLSGFGDGSKQKAEETDNGRRLLYAR